jgi:hypothetical protein
MTADSLGLNDIVWYFVACRIEAMTRARSIAYHANSNDIVGDLSLLVARL